MNVTSSVTAAVKFSKYKCKVEEQKTNLMSLAILFLFLCAEHVSYVAGWSTSASACNADTTPTQPHRNSNTHRTKTNVVIQQHSLKLLMRDTLMYETCSAHKKRNKIASDIKLVFYSSTITMVHGPINIRLQMQSYWKNLKMTAVFISGAQM